MIRRAVDRRFNTVSNGRGGPRRGEMKVEVGETDCTFDRVRGWRRTPTAKADRLKPAIRVRQLIKIVVGTGKAARACDRHGGDCVAAGEQMNGGRALFQRDSRGVKR